MSPSPVPIVSALYGGIIGFLLLFLAARVSGMRRKLKIGMGDAGDRALQRAVRAHGNAVEWAIVAILLLLVAELTRASALLLHLCGIAIVVGRLLHAFGLSRASGYSFGRFTGSVLSWGAVAVLSAWNVWAWLRLLLV